MKKYDVYLYGMTLVSTSIRLPGAFPQSDGYCEIKSKDKFVGGEIGCCANVLSSMGVSSIVDGNYQGGDAYWTVQDFFRDSLADTSCIVNKEGFSGIEDLVIISGEDRLCLGTFQNFYKEKIGYWNTPVAENISRAKVAGIDPFFLEESREAAKICSELNIPYVTIDCRCDSTMSKLCAVNVVSAEYIRNVYKGCDIEALFKRYTDATDGLIIFTFGPNEIMYGRKGEAIKRFKPFSVTVESTLGAGDTFRTGVIFALLKGMNDDQLVAFSAATAAAAISKYPIACNPPTIDRIEAFLK